MHYITRLGLRRGEEDCEVRSRANSLGVIDRAWKIETDQGDRVIIP